MLEQQEKVKLSDQELTDLIKEISFDAERCIMVIKSDLGILKEILTGKLASSRESNKERDAEFNDKRRTNIVETAKKLLSKVQEKVKYLNKKTNYAGVEEILEIEKNILEFLTKALSDIEIENVDIIAKNYRTGKEQDICQDLDQVDELITDFEITSLHQRYFELQSKQNKNK
ncbi:MAG: hypothetical protein ABIH87_02755 [bacterium]